MTEGISGKPIESRALDVYIHDPYRKRNQTSPHFQNTLSSLLKSGTESSNAIKSANSSEPDDAQRILANQSRELWPLQLQGSLIAQVDDSGYDQQNTALKNLTQEDIEYFNNIRPADYDDAKYQAVLQDHDRRLGLLNPRNLPTSTSGFQLVTFPEPGKSRSTDMEFPPTFAEISGGIMRTDHTISGDVYTFIPVTEWRLVGTGDAAVGTVYSQQLPWGFRSYFDRGGGPPVHLGFQPGKYDQRLNTLLGKTRDIVREDFLARA